MFATNVEGTRRVLGACADARPAPRVVHCSSMSVVGPSASGILLSEESPLAPVSWYGDSKVHAERLALEHRDRLALSVVRPPVLYGPRDPGMLPLFRAAAGRVLPRLAGTPRSMSLLYAADCAEAMITVARTPASVGRTYFASEPSPVETERLMAEVVRAVGGRPLRVSVPRVAVTWLAVAGDLVGRIAGQAPLLGRQRVRDLTGTHWVCTPAALERDTGWRATTPLRDGIDRTASWYRAQGWLRTPGPVEARP
jgi:nucleoside-diphosphate-sugar epimerase